MLFALASFFCLFFPPFLYSRSTQKIAGPSQAGGGARAPPLFGRSVNPISTRGGHIIPTQYYVPSRIFRPCDGPVICTYKGKILTFTIEFVKQKTFLYQVDTIQCFKRIGNTKFSKNFGWRKMTDAARTQMKCQNGLFTFSVEMSVKLRSQAVQYTAEHIKRKITQP